MRGTPHTPYTRRLALRAALTAATLATTTHTASVPIDFAQETGSPAAFAFLGWNTSDPTGTDAAFPGYATSCASKNIPAALTHIECGTNTLTGPPRLTRHSVVPLEYVDPTNASITHDYLVAFGGQGDPGAAPGEIAVNFGTQGATYEYDVTHTIWYHIAVATGAVAPPARHLHAAVAVAKYDVNGTVLCERCRMIVHGGYTDDSSILEDLWAYDGEAKTWTQLATTTAALAGHTGVTAGRFAYFYGGVSGADDLPTAKVYRFDLQTNAWDEVQASGDDVVPTFVHTAVLVASDPVTPPASTPADEAHPQPVDTMVVYGGLAADGTTQHSSFYLLNLTSMVWSTRSAAPGGGYTLSDGTRVASREMPNSRYGHVCLYMTHKLLCFGGSSFDDDATKPAIFAYNNVLDRIEFPAFANAIETTTVYTVGVATRRGRGFAFGGAAGQEGDAAFPEIGFWAIDYSPPMCAGGRFSPDGNYKCYPCPTGYASRPYNCEGCDAGTYRSDDGDACVDCPAGTYNDQAFTEGEASCTKCPAGQQQPAAKATSVSACTPCVVGTYAPAAGTAGCLPCPGGSTAVAGVTAAESPQAACEPCAFGQYSAGGTAACVACPPGTSSFGFVKRLQPYSLAIAGYSTARAGGQCSDACTASCAAPGESGVLNRCETCPRKICGTACPTAVDVSAGEVVHVKIHVYDIGSRGSTDTAPHRMLRLSRNVMGVANGVTVERKSGPGPLLAPCYGDFPDNCTEVPAHDRVLGTAHASTPAGHACRTADDIEQAFHFSVRFDVAGLAELVFRADGLMPATLLLNVTGSRLAVLDPPPSHAVATGVFTLGLGYIDPAKNVITGLGSASIDVLAPQCATVVGGVANHSLAPLPNVNLVVGSGSPSAGDQTAVAALTQGTATLALALSGNVFDSGLVGLGDSPDGRMIECFLTFRVASDGETATTPAIRVQQPKDLRVTWAPGTGTHTGEPMAVTVDVVDVDNLRVQGDDLTGITLATTSGPQVVDLVTLNDVGSVPSAVSAGSMARYVRATAAGTVAFAATAGTAYGDKAGSIPVGEGTLSIGFPDTATGTALNVAWRGDPAVDPSLDDALAAQMSSHDIMRFAIRAEDSSGHIDHATSDIKTLVSVTGCTPLATLSYVSSGGLTDAILSPAAQWTFIEDETQVTIPIPVTCRTEVTHIRLQAKADGFACGYADIRVAIGGASRTVKVYYEEWATLYVNGLALAGDTLNVVVENLNYFCDIEVELNVHAKQDCVQMTAGAAESNVDCPVVTLDGDESDNNCRFAAACPAVVEKVEMRADVGIICALGGVRLRAAVNEYDGEVFVDEGEWGTVTLNATIPEGEATRVVVTNVAGFTSCEAIIETRVFIQETCSHEVTKRLIQGRGAVALRITGDNANSCNLRVSHVPNDNDPADIRDGSRTIATWTSSPFDIVNPTQMDVAWGVPIVGGNCTARLGTYNYTATLIDGANPVTWHDGDGEGRLYLRVAVLFAVNGSPVASLAANASEYITLHALGMSADGSVGYIPVVNGVGSVQVTVNRALDANATFQIVAEAGRFDRPDGVNAGGTFAGPAAPVVIAPGSTCATAVVPQATTIAVVTPLTWIGAFSLETVRLEARDAHGGLVDINATAFDVAIHGCESGSAFPKFYVGTAEAVADTFIPGGAFEGGTAMFRFYGERTVAHWNHDTTHQEMKGVENCRWRVRATTGNGDVIEGETAVFEFKNLAGACEKCAAGHWSPGSWGVQSGYPHSTAGCTPCMIGTYSGVAGGTSEASCIGCAQGFGFKDQTTWDPVLRKPAGEGMSICNVCPSGSTSAGSPYNGGCSNVAQSDAIDTTPTFGTLGKYCAAAICEGCAAGAYQLTCNARTNQSTCTDASTQNMCKWDAVAGVCSFVNPENEPVQCVPCPAGTVQPITGNYGDEFSCMKCEAGTFSAEVGHDEAVAGYRDARACFEGAVVKYACIGTGSGQCPDGTYGPHGGMASSAECQKCPAGTWSRQTPLQVAKDADPVCRNAGTGLPQPTGACTVATGGCSPCHNDNGVCTADDSYPLVPPLGVPQCYSCPPGTYSTSTALTDSSSCRACPAAHFCPPGTGAPHPVDRETSILHTALVASSKGTALTLAQSGALYANLDARLGALETKAYGFPGTHEPNLCEVPGAVANDVPIGGGWIEDAHFDYHLWWEAPENLFGHDFANEHMVNEIARGEVTGVRVRGDELLVGADHTQPLTAHYPALCGHLAGYTPDASQYFADAGVFLCCPSSCLVSNGGPGCGRDAAQCLPANSNPFRSQCCLNAVISEANVCGAAHNGVPAVPCYITGPATSGSLELTLPHDPVVFRYQLQLRSIIDLHFQVYGKTLVVDNMGYTAHDYGVKLRFFASSLAETADFAAEEVTLTFPQSAAAGNWEKLEATISLNATALPAVYSVAIGYFTTAPGSGTAPTPGSYVVLFDDVSLRPDPSVACECSLGYFYNATRLTMTDPFPSACQRCPPNHFCNGGALQQCSTGYAQGGSYECDACPEGWRCNYDARGSSTPCPAYTYEDPDLAVDRCIVCPLGHACRDGEIEVCPPGQFGDGSQHCHLCLPGYFTDFTGFAKQEGARRCTKCPPGTYSNPMRTACPACPVNTFSVDGDYCETCPQHFFTAGPGSTGCLDCRLTASFPTQTLEVARNAAPVAITLVPLKCVPEVDWKVLRYQHTGTALGSVRWMDETQCDTTSVLYEVNANVIGTDVVEFVLDTGVNTTEQTVRVTINVANRPPTARDDYVEVRVSVNALTIDIEELLQNDEDPDNDVMFIHDAGWASTDGRHNVLFSGVTSDRRGVSLTLPGGFNGPVTGNFWYSVQDSSDPSCVSPACMISEKAYVTLVAEGLPPIGVADSYATFPSATNIFDVVANDYDNDGDTIDIVSVTKALPSGGFENQPQVVRMCDATACRSGGTAPCLLAVDAISNCNCVYNSVTAVCEPRASFNGDTVGRIRNTYIRYTALPTFCGEDTFSYSIRGTEATVVPVEVKVNVTNCVCRQGAVMFVVESPSTTQEWGDAKDFISSIVARFDFQDSPVAMGLVQTSDYGQVKLERALAPGSISNALAGSALLGQETMQGDPVEAIEKAEDELDAYDSQGGPKVIIVLRVMAWPQTSTSALKLQLSSKGYAVYVVSVLYTAMVTTTTSGHGTYLTNASRSLEFVTFPQLLQDPNPPIDIVDSLCGV